MWQVCKEHKSRKLALLCDTWQLVHVFICGVSCFICCFCIVVLLFSFCCSYVRVPSLCTFCYSLGRICSNLHGAHTAAGNLPFSQSGDIIENTVYLCDWTNHFIVWALFYFTVVQNFIWRAKCSLGLPHWNNILLWLCKTVTLSSFISSLCLGWLRRRSSRVIYGCGITCWYRGLRFTCMGASGCL